MKRVNSVFFAFLRRMKFIKRWGLMHNREEENLQEHSFEVACIAHQLALAQNRYFGGSLDVGDIVLHALYHDMSEVITGDLPTPIKYFAPSMRQMYGEIEELAQDRLLATLPEDLQADYGPYIKETREGLTAKLVKAADVLSAYMKCLSERSMGSEEFAEAEAASYKKLKDMELPVVDWFLDTYTKDITASLDTISLKK